jgi:two-component system response regulator GlrR
MPSGASRSYRMPAWVVAVSPAFRAVLAQVARLAPYDVPVLIEGETGVGKEVVVRLLHYLSERRGRPFIPVNAGAIVDTLFESELFGHAAGAFTDARARSKGLVGLAEGGTLFLDEIDSLSPHGQVALLRFLQDRTYRPVGSDSDCKADVRMVAATNADLGGLMQAGRIRKDLYYRLSSVILRVPPLRERQADIVPLATHVLADLNARLGHERVIGPALAAWLQVQPWPGNVRELRSIIEHSFIMSDGDILEPPGMAPEDRGAEEAACFRDAKAKAISLFERDYCARLMQQCDGNVSQAARVAGKERKSFDRLLRKHGVERGPFMPPPRSAG